HQVIQRDAQGPPQVEEGVGPDAALAGFQVRQEALADPGLLGKYVLGPAKLLPASSHTLANALHGTPAAAAFRHRKIPQAGRSSSANESHCIAELSQISAPEPGGFQRFL